MSTKVKTWSNFIKFEHSIFALPFAMISVVVVSRFQSIGLDQCFAILICLICARSSAMAFNRIVDRDVDAQNPRTKNRELVTGEVSLRGAWSLCLGTGLAFLLSALWLGEHCFVLAPFVLAILYFYSYTKRFSSYAHIVLGFALALAPGGVWLALTGRYDFEPMLLMLAVLFWVAGFDILYSCQDREFDQQKALFSIPVALGVSKAFFVAKVFHILSVFILITFGYAADLGNLYFIGVICFGVLLFTQYLLVSPGNLEKIDQAFFVKNGQASIMLFLFTLADRLL